MKEIREDTKRIMQFKAAVINGPFYGSFLKRIRIAHRATSLNLIKSF